MRQLGTLPDARSARTLADYLDSLSIETRVESTPEGFIVWVCDEDRLARAREEFQRFRQNPADPGFLPLARKKEKEPEPAPTRPAEPRLELESRPPVTTVLIVVSVLVSVAYLSGDGSAVTRTLLISTVETKSEGIIEWVPQFALDELSRGELWRLVTPIFVHFGVLHLVFNMMWLHTFASQIERHSGSLRLALLVVLIAVLSNLAQYLGSMVVLEGMRMTLEPRHGNPGFGGMSGVVFGLFGYVWVRALYERDCPLEVGRGTVILLLAWLVVCMTGWVGPIANTAHVVGLVVGVFAGYVAARWNGFGERERGA